MIISENINLQKYADAANEQFERVHLRILEIEETIKNKMHGKTVLKIVGSILGTIIWFALFGTIFYYTRGYDGDTICFGVTLALLSILLIEEILQLSYYGKITAYSKRISQLKTSVSVSKDSLVANKDTIVNSRSNGWQHCFEVVASIPEEMALIEKAINGMEALKSGFLNGLKTMLFFGDALVMTIGGSLALKGVASRIVFKIAEMNPGPTNEMILELPEFCVFFAPLVELMLVGWIWAAASSITNKCIGGILLGPLLYLGLSALITFIYVLVVWAFAIVAGVFMLIITIAIAAGIIGAFSGG